MNRKEGKKKEGSAAGTARKAAMVVKFDGLP